MFSPIMLAAAALTLGPWGAAGCGPVGPNAGYVWRTRPDDPGRSYLYRGGVQIGGYDHDHQVFRSYDARTGTWGPRQPPPWQARASEAVRNFGVDTEKLSGGTDERFVLNGIAASREEVRKVLADRKLPDDAGRLRLTLIGEPALTGSVTNDLARSPALAEWKERLLVQTYPPDHWVVARGGFKTDGRPTIYVQAPDGAVLHRQDDYRDGAEGLASALRRADPHYDPATDPDLRQRRLLPNFSLPSIPAPAWLLAAGVLFLLLRRR